MCDTLPPAPLSVRPSVRLSGLALAFALKRITIVIINASLSLSLPVLSLKDCRALLRVMVVEILG